MQALHGIEATLSILVLTVIAAINDLRHRRIPNSLIIAGIACGLGLSFYTAGTEGIITSLAGFGAGFLLVLPGYLLRFTGAGDVKLLATMGLFCGPVVILKIFIASVFAAALFVLLRTLWIIFINIGHSFAARYKFMHRLMVPTGQHECTPLTWESVRKQRLPMAPFYTLGVLVVLTPTLV